MGAVTMIGDYPALIWIIRYPPRRGVRLNALELTGSPATIAFIRFYFEPYAHGASPYFLVGHANKGCAAFLVRAAVGTVPSVSGRLSAFTRRQSQDRRQHQAAIRMIGLVSHWLFCLPEASRIILRSSSRSGAWTQPSDAARSHPTTSQTDRSPSRRRPNT